MLRDKDEPGRNPLEPGPDWSAWWFLSAFLISYMEFKDPVIALVHGIFGPLFLIWYFWKY